METNFDPKAAVDTVVALFTRFGFDTNRLIREAFGEAGFAAPAQVHVFRNA